MCCKQRKCEALRCTIYINEFFFIQKIGARQDIHSNFSEGIDEGSNCGLVGVSITSGNRKCPKKFFTLTLKIIGCERKCHFFHFFLALIEI